MMMKRGLATLVLLSLVTFLPGVAQARGYGRSGGYVNTPFGAMNMQTMAQAGGNPMMAQEIQQQQMMYQQQMMMMRQQQQMQKMMNDPKYKKQMEEQQKAYLNSKN